MMNLGFLSQDSSRFLSGRWRNTLSSGAKEELSVVFRISGMNRTATEAPPQGRSWRLGDHCLLVLGMGSLAQSWG